MEGSHEFIGNSLINNKKKKKSESSSKVKGTKDKELKPSTSIFLASCQTDEESYFGGQVDNRVIS